MLLEALVEVPGELKVDFSARNCDLTYICVHATISQVQQRNLETSQ